MALEYDTLKKSAEEDLENLKTSAEEMACTDMECNWLYIVITVRCIRSEKRYRRNMV